jgi:hypothetical protein
MKVERSLRSVLFTVHNFQYDSIQNKQIPLISCYLLSAHFFYNMIMGWEGKFTYGLGTPSTAVRSINHIYSSVPYHMYSVHVLYRYRHTVYRSNPLQFFHQRSVFRYGYRTTPGVVDPNRVRPVTFRVRSDPDPEYSFRIRIRPLRNKSLHNFGFEKNVQLVSIT